MFNSNVFNLLFLNVGRRCELVEAFRAALNGGGVIFGSDISPLAPGLQVVDQGVVFKNSEGPEFESELIEFCKAMQISLVIPTIDPDLERLDALRAKFGQALPQCRLLIPPTETITLCRNKQSSKQTATYAAVGVAEELKDPKSFPVFVRPFGGSAGQGAQRVDTPEELQLLVKRDPKLLVEAYLDGDEITVDVLCDFNGNPLMSLPRRRLKVRAGEVVQAVLERDASIESLAAKLARAFHATGPVTVQFMRTQEGNLFFTEMNARMGGGLPLSIAAGAHWPLWILDLCQGRTPNVHVPIHNGMIMTRADRSFFLPKSQ